MKRIALVIVTGSILILALSNRAMAAPELSADDIVAKNVAARGGLDTWRKIQTMVWIGHVEKQNRSAAELPFTLEMKRPNKSRFRIEVQNQIAVNLFGGTRGWKLRTVRDGQPQVQPYTSEEVQFAQSEPGLDGPLIDHQTKGINVTLAGSGEVDGHKAYRLQVKLPSGVTEVVWVDARTFLEIRCDREVHTSFGQSDQVSVHYADYRSVEGVKIPFAIETTAAAAKVSDKMVLDRILINSPLEDQLFELPGRQERRNVVSIDARSRTGNRTLAPTAAALPNQQQ